MMDAAQPNSGVAHLAHFRQLVTLPDGLRICLRPLVAADRDALVALFKSLSADDLQYFRSDVTDPAIVIAHWAEAEDDAHVFPLVAVVGDQLVGTCTLHIGSGPTRHLAEIRVFLAKEFRRRGIGTAMLKTQIEIARKLGLQQIIAEIVESRPQVAHAFEHLGFQKECVLRDHFMTPNGETLDLIVMVRYLRHAAEEF
jgi:RimJ/RimL family protein N-acetyltransferase